MKVRLSKEHRNKQISYGGSLFPVMQQILMRESPNLRSGHRAIEYFWVASPDNKNRLLNVELVNLGSVNRLQVSQPKVGTEVFRIAIYKAAPRVVLVHNPATSGGTGTQVAILANTPPTNTIKTLPTT
jgi:hypothetical protein